MKKIKRFGIIQTASVGGLVYFLLSLIIFIPFGLISVGFNNSGFGTMPFGGSFFLFVAPFIYGVMGFIMTAACCGIYNMVSKWIGGIEVEVVDADAEKQVSSAD